MVAIHVIYIPFYSTRKSIVKHMFVKGVSCTAHLPVSKIPTMDKSHVLLGQGGFRWCLNAD